MPKFLKTTTILILICNLTAFALPLRTGICQSDEINSGYLSHLEFEVVKELNLARSQPEAYAKFLSPFLQLFHGNEFREPGEICILTQEGRSAVIEAIRFLENQGSIPIF